MHFSLSKTTSRGEYRTARKVLLWVGSPVWLEERVRDTCSMRIVRGFNVFGVFLIVTLLCKNKRYY